MKEVNMVANIAQFLVGTLTLLRANINQINPVGLLVVHLFKSAANNRNGWSYLQYSTYMGELVYMILMYGPKTAASLAVTDNKARWLKSALTTTTS